jgi:hypothetical protein
MKLKTFGNS